MRENKKKKSPARSKIISKSPATAGARINNKQFPTRPRHQCKIFRVGVVKELNAWCWGDALFRSGWAGPKAMIQEKWWMCERCHTEPSEIFVLLMLIQSDGLLYHAHVWGRRVEWISSAKRTTARRMYPERPEVGLRTQCFWPKSDGFLRGTVFVFGDAASVGVGGEDGPADKSLEEV
ncbi:hypothetical protein SODALDRAFT_137249 [Sodiomyces alkalinus F11]|uniref:Uncharacterized protein n=1 Tax=Sodiomyces alkalinus (strain CBS 110278 / VKM F-3762 / F11) TaxID=1314773 RepID=A0A3N2PZH6_SODAK|nr:hypothetical protein SODALDRAFT_137249 [Sodiomyces alkalinus F11]ROT39755.1 hypothetical protein SODALDRAFT_137249 [Sodiomyces alkalinus F11]